jgi:Ser/Thr protein kinase RdoA (MazF antagonist)
MQSVLDAFGLSLADYKCDRITTGHINFTYKLTGSKNFILQRVNKNIFKNPEIIAANLRLAANYLSENYPDYFFSANIPATDGSEMVYDAEGFPWRLFPYLKNTTTVNHVNSEEEAFRAAEGFGKLTACLWNCDPKLFRETIPRFHDLSLRFEQFENALLKSNPERKNKAASAIQLALKNYNLVDKYNTLIESRQLNLRVMHNDTKINNILFDATTRQVVSVIDLDTLMPGYFIYDLGDMIRTFTSPVDEEESDIKKIEFRKDIYDALIEGYFGSMGACLNEDQKSLAPFAGYMMTYIMALRFLTDYLNGDVYYQTHYEGQNLVRAQNQLHLLSTLCAYLK